MTTAAAPAPVPATDDLGTVEWRLPNGETHREDGPAVESFNGALLWFRHDQLHRLDGPAAEYPDGGNYWYVHGRHIPDTGGVLSRLYDAGEVDILTAVLSVWQPGLDVTDLVEAVAIAGTTT